MCNVNTVSIRSENEVTLPVSPTSLMATVRDDLWLRLASQTHSDRTCACPLSELVCVKLYIHMCRVGLW